MKILKSTFNYILGLLIVTNIISCKNKTNNTSPAFEQIKLENINQPLIITLIKDIDERKIQNIHALVILQNGNLLLEHYFSGYSATDKQYTASVSKSIGSVLMGIAMGQGVFPGLNDNILDKPIFELLPEYSRYFSEDTVKKQILFRHALSMAGGLEWNEQSFPYDDRRNDWNAASNSNDPIAYLLQKKMVNAPGERFNYNGGYSILLSYLIENSTGKPALAYAKKHLFEPLEIEDFVWDNVVCGLTDFDGGLYLRPIDMAKLGQLFLWQGNWRGEQIVPNEWIEKSTFPHMENINGPDYGFQWWCGEFHTIDTAFFVYLASGHGGQHIFVVPDLKTVIVICQQVFDNPLGELNSIAMISNYIIPALTNTSTERQYINIKNKNLIDFAGRYISSQTNNFVNISVQNNRLLLTGSDGIQIELRPISEVEFIGSVLHILPVKVTFKRTDEGSVSTITSSFGFRKAVFEKE